MTQYAPGSTIITRHQYDRQIALAGQYRLAGKYRVRSWLPPRSIQRKMREFVESRDGGLCHICGNPARAPHLDHVKPYRDGGLFIEWNLRLACEGCNTKRGSRPMSTEEQ